MKFRAEHVFDASIAELEAAIFDDPGFYEMLPRECASLEAVRLVARRDHDGVVEREVAYTPRGKIPGFAERWITREMVSWVEASRYRRDQARFDYEIRPNIPRRWLARFASSGSYRLHEDGGRTRRVVEGEITIRALVLGGLAERFLCGEVKKTFDEEARALQGFVARRRHAQRHDQEGASS